MRRTRLQITAIFVCLMLATGLLEAQGNAPTIIAVAPTSLAAGSAQFELVVRGTNFRDNATVRWNGANRVTAYIDGERLTAEILQGDLAQPGTAQVTVVQRVGQQDRESNVMTFTITSSGTGTPGTTGNPVPVIATLSPSPMTAGAINQDLYVDGSGFVSGTRIRWNGSDRSTDSVGPTRVKTVISGEDLAVPGTAQITTHNPGPGGGTSASRALQIVHLKPAITSLDPKTRAQGGSGFTLTVSGSGFLSTGTNIVKWNGQPRTTHFVNPSRLTATIPDSDLTSIGDATVTVETRAGASSQTSAPATATVYATATTATVTTVAAASTPISLTKFHIGGASNPDRVRVNTEVALYAEHSGSPAPTHWKSSIDDGRALRLATWQPISTAAKHTFTTVGQHVRLFQYRRIAGSDTTVSNVGRDTIMIRPPWVTPPPVVFGEMTANVRRLHCDVGDAVTSMRIYEDADDVVTAIGISCGSRNTVVSTVGSTSRGALRARCSVTDRVSGLSVGFDAPLSATGLPIGASMLVYAPYRGKMHHTRPHCESDFSDESAGPARFNSLYAVPEAGRVTPLRNYEATVGCQTGAFPVGVDVYLKRFSPIGETAYDLPSAVGFICARPD